MWKEFIVVYRYPLDNFAETCMMSTVIYDCKNFAKLKLFNFSHKGTLLYGHLHIKGSFFWSRRKAHIFSLKRTRLERAPVNIRTNERHSCVLGHKLSYFINPTLRTPAISTHCLFILSQSCDNCRHGIISCSSNGRFLWILTMACPWCSY